jgi:hypothetical protein
LRCERLVFCERQPEVVMYIAGPSHWALLVLCPPRYYDDASHILRETILRRFAPIRFTCRLCRCVSPLILLVDHGEDSSSPASLPASRRKTCRSSRTTYQKTTKSFGVSLVAPCPSHRRVWLPMIGGQVYSGMAIGRRSRN